MPGFWRSPWASSGPGHQCDERLPFPGGDPRRPWCPSTRWWTSHDAVPESLRRRMALLLRESDVEGLVDLDAAIGAVETAFRDLAQGRAENCPRSRASFGGATLNVLYSFSTRLDAIALKSYPIVRSDVTVGSSFVILVYSLSGGA